VCLGQTSQTEADSDRVEMHFVGVMGISKGLLLSVSQVLLIKAWVLVKE